MPYPLLRRSGVAAALVGCVSAVIVGSCVPPPVTGGLDPRYVAVHNALAATGLVEVGPLRRGPLSGGHEIVIPIELAAPCTTAFVMGTVGLSDLDVTMVDPSGARVAHDSSHEPEVALRTCAATGGTFTLILRAGSGNGEFLLATWGGASGGVSPTASAAQVGGDNARGTCEAPIRISTGEYTGSTSHGESENEGSCASSGARELVYRIDLSARKSLSIEVTTQRFDSVLYVRKTDCGDESAEVACNDDAPNQHRSKIDAVFDPGTYFIFVDGYGSDGGPFQLKVSARDVPPLAEVCGKAVPLAFGSPQTGSMSGAFDEVHASCGEEARGPDIPFGLEISARSRVRVRDEADDFSPVVHIRKVCADEGSEVGCAAAETGEHSASVVGLLDPGAYTVFADASDHDADGRFSLFSEVVPEHGSGAPGDACADAIPLRRSEPTVTGDTFRARDDTSGSCGGAGSADVIYRLELARRSRFAAAFSSEEAAHIFILSKLCADRSSEIACGRSVDETLGAGTYTLAVDGDSPDAFGAFTFDWSLRDTVAQEAGCAAAPQLTMDLPITGTTAGASNKFAPSCGVAGSGSQGDRVYRFTMPARGRVRLSLTTPHFTGVLALRSSCQDTAASTGHPLELACSAAGEDSHQAHLEANLEAGVYYVVVDGKGIGASGEGAYTLLAHVTR
jgi:hypothetical protein